MSRPGPKLGRLFNERETVATKTQATLPYEPTFTVAPAAEIPAIVQEPVKEPVKESIRVEPYHEWPVVIQDQNVVARKGIPVSVEKTEWVVNQLRLNGLKEV